MWKPRTLLVTDPNLGQHAFSRVAPLCENLTWISWDLATSGGSEDVLAQIADGTWALAISFYSDLVFPPAALAAVNLPLNIHPALPRIRGVGHDLVPLVERHETHGVTLHRMDRGIDTGRILDVLEAPLPPGQTYHSLRARNQSLSLEMLDRLCRTIEASPDLAALERALEASAEKTPHRWGDYYSRKTVAGLRATHPDLLELQPVERSRAL